jgi:hypothetical protein
MLLTPRRILESCCSQSGTFCRNHRPVAPFHLAPEPSLRPPPAASIPSTPRGPSPHRGQAAATPVDEARLRSTGPLGATGNRSRRPTKTAFKTANQRRSTEYGVRRDSIQFAPAVCALLGQQLGIRGPHRRRPGPRRSVLPVAPAVEHSTPCGGQRQKCIATQFLLILRNYGLAQLREAHQHDAALRLCPMLSSLNQLRERS